MWILRVAVCLAAPILVAAQCDIGPDRLKKKPDPFLIGDARGVSVWSEVSSDSVSETYIVHEVHDKTSDRFFLEFYDNKEGFERLLYDRKKNAMYSYTDNVCVALNGAKIADFYATYNLMRLLHLTDVPKEGFLGPASYFENFALSKPQDASEVPCDNFDRNIECVEYLQCNPMSSLWYSKEGYEIFNQKKSRPLRIMLANGVLIDILDIKTYAKHEILDLFVPTGLSCDSKTEENVVIPSDPTQRAFESEIVLTTDKSDSVYISQLSGIIIPSVKQPSEEKKNGDFSGLYSFTMNTFFGNDKATDFVAGNRRRIIHDVDRGFVYEHNYNKDESSPTLEKVDCKIYVDADFTAEVELPFYGAIDLKPLLLQVPVAQTGIVVNHLGDNRIRFVDTDVYEATYPLYRTGSGIELSRFVVTYHFGRDTSSLQAIELTGYVGQNKAFRATIHVTKYEPTIVQLNQKLRIDDCYDYIDKSELRWFQIGFETKTSMELADISKSSFKIREAFMNKLFNDYRVEPMRIPQVNVDLVSSQVVISTLLLERPLLNQAFRNPLKKDFRAATKTIGIMSLSACQITCLGMDGRDCTAISYCGATCSISAKQTPAAPINTIDSTECRLFERDLSSTVSSSSQILNALRSDVNTKVPQNQLRFVVTFTQEGDFSGNVHAVELTATTFDDTQNFDNVFHFDKSKVAIIETSFNLANARKRLDPQSQATVLGSLDLEDCALACKNRKDCETFSYCQNSRECTISAAHDIRSENIKDDSQCIIYQTKYVERFDRLPGLTVQAPGINMKTTNVDSCAQQCVARSDCKSFEFCDASGDCVLLTTHITDATAIGSNNADLKCNHYSKKYLFDYNVVADSKGNGDKTTELAAYQNVNQATCAKLCSEWADAATVCMSFDFCASEQDNTGVCTLRTVDGKGTPAKSPSCDFFYAKFPPKRDVMLHGAGAAFGFSILMILIGVALAVGGLFVYGKFH